ncbi:hypothetical protein GDO86_002659, partial [Hymenochirus boettgeri]
NECSDIHIHTKKYMAVIKEPLVLECPVSFCSNDPPNVSWCKLHKTLCEPLHGGSGLTMGWKVTEKDSAIYLLNFNSMTLDDVGYYRCSLDTNKFIVAPYISVNISGKS